MKRRIKQLLFACGLATLVSVLSVRAALFLVRPTLADAAHIVSLNYDNQSKTYATDAATVGEVLSRAGISLNQGDVSQPTADYQLGKDPVEITVFRARPVLVIEADKSTPILTGLQQPRAIAEAAGFTVYPEDNLSLEPVTDFVSDRIIGQRVVIQPATPFSVSADGKTSQFRTQAKTVGEAIKAAGISLGAKDTITPDPTSNLQPNAVVVVTRVAEADITTTETLQRPVKNVTDPDLLKGKTQVKSEGSDGHRTVTYHVHYVNGVETSRQQVAVTDQVDPQPEVVATGTKILFAGSIEYWRPQVDTAAAKFGVDSNLMLAIMKCESGGRANANGGGYYGLYQYNKSLWHSVGGTDDNILDGTAQINATAKYIAANGTGPWAASKWCWGN